MFENWSEVISNSECNPEGVNVKLSPRCTAKPVAGKACFKWRLRDDFQNQSSMCEDSVEKIIGDKKCDNNSLEYESKDDSHSYKTEPDSIDSQIDSSSKIKEEEIDRVQKDPSPPKLSLSEDNSRLKTRVDELERTVTEQVVEIEKQN